MEKLNRLSFRIVVLGPDVANYQDVVSRIKVLIAPVGTFYDWNASPYPKIADSHMVWIQFDAPAPFEGGIERVIELVGGTGWHIAKDNHEQVAIWASSDGLAHPFGKHFSWCQIQLFPHEQLAKESNKK